MTELVPVQSSNLDAIGYDPEGQALYVRFKSSATIHRYSDVPPQVHADLMAADSKGAHFFRHVRNAYKRTLPMPQINVTAPDGVMVKVHIQSKSAHQGFDEHTGEKMWGWKDDKIEAFASEMRSYEVNVDKRIIVEQGQ